MLYVGDYGGYMNAVNARTGKLKWQSGSLGPGFGGGGTFYSTPAVAFGRVYAGNNDGRVYSYDLEDGTLAWTHSTGGYVYSGPTVARTPSTPPTVYVGSFDGNIYALNAKNGETRWSHSAGGQVIGSLSAVGNIVYVAEFTNTATNGYDMRDRSARLPLQDRRLHAGHLRRAAHLPDRLLEHQRPAAVPSEAEARNEGEAAAGSRGWPVRKRWRSQVRTDE